jgi:fructoselysine 6-kinase
VHLAAQGAKVAYFGATGNDAEGAAVREAMRKRDIDCAHLAVREGDTAATWIEVRKGERIILEDRAGVQCPLRLSAEDLESLAEHGFVHCPAFTSWNIEWRQAQPALVEEIEFLWQRGCFVSVDFSEMEEPELARLLGRFVGVAFASRGSSASEAQVEKTMQYFHECGTPEVLVTLGRAGAAYSRNGVIRTPALSITPVDTLGAGDAFIAGWLFSRMAGEDARTCLKRATRVAAEACRYFGAWPHAGEKGPTLNAGSANFRS